MVLRITRTAPGIPTINVIGIAIVGNPGVGIAPPQNNCDSSLILDLNFIRFSGNCTYREFVCQCQDLVEEDRSPKKKRQGL